MSPEAQRILDEIRRLPADEREVLLDLIDHEFVAEFSPEQIAEFRRRSAEIDSGEAKLIPWSEIRGQWQKRIDDARGG